MTKHYFKNLPNFGYKNNLESSVDRENYVYAKNLILRAKIRDDVEKLKDSNRRIIYQNGDKTQ